MYDLQDVLDRVADMAQEAVGTVIQQGGGSAVESSWVAYWPYWQETLPYGAVRINSMTTRTDLSGAIDLDVYTLGLELVVGHLQAGEAGEIAGNQVTYIQAILEFFRNHADLTSAAYATPPDDLWIEPHGAHITGIPGGQRTINANGVPTPQLVIEFEVEVPLMALYDPA